MTPTREQVVAFLKNLEQATRMSAQRSREASDRHERLARKSKHSEQAKYFMNTADINSERAASFKQEADLFAAAVLFLEGR